MKINIVSITRNIFKKRSFIHEKRISDFSPRYETPAPQSGSDTCFDRSIYSPLTLRMV